MRWTVPTLVDTLYRNGCPLDVAADVVKATYPLTGGDEDFRSIGAMPDDRRAVGPYALWLTLRGDYPSDAPTHAGADARTIVAALRGAEGQLDEVVDIAAHPDVVVNDAVNRTVDMIRAGVIIEPRQVDTNNDTAIELEQIGRRIADQAAIVGPLFDTMFRNT